MKIIVALFSIFLIGLSIDISNLEQHSETPQSYIHADSSLIITPHITKSVDNLQYIEDWSLTYSDGYYCSDLAKIKLVDRTTGIELVFTSKNKINCDITAKISVTWEQSQIIHKSKIDSVVIQNLVTDNTYSWSLDDAEYFSSQYKLQNWTGTFPEKKVQIHKNSGWVK